MSGQWLLAALQLVARSGAPPVLPPPTATDTARYELYRASEGVVHFLDTGAGAVERVLGLGRAASLVRALGSRGTVRARAADSLDQSLTDLCARITAGQIEPFRSPDDVQYRGRALALLLFRDLNTFEAMLSSKGDSAGFVNTACAPGQFACPSSDGRGLLWSVVPTGRAFSSYASLRASDSLAQIQAP